MPKSTSRRPPCLAALLLLASCGAPAGSAADTTASPAEGVRATVARVTDGDTLHVNELEQAVRLLGVDAPESVPSVCPGGWDAMSDEDRASHPDCCYGAEAAAQLEALLPPGTAVRLVNPEGGELQPDNFGRVLADVYLGNVNIAGKLAAFGCACVYGGKYAHPTLYGHLLSIAEAAAESGVGMWGACPPHGVAPCN